MTIINNYQEEINIKNEQETKFLKRIQGNNIVLTEVISNQDPFADLHKSMREEAWYWDSNYDY